MKSKTFTFRIRRSDPAEGQEGSYQSYSLDVPRGMTVLEALLRIQSEQDGSLAFRYACRGAVCGSCAMMINGREALACRTQVHGLLEETPTVYEGSEREEAEWLSDENAIVLEPLRNLEVVKDLVVEMESFFGRLEAVEPWLQPGRPLPNKEWLVDPQAWSETEPYTNCILCACCYSVCPAAEEDPDYLGPAALAQSYRFLADGRDAAEDERLDLVAGVHGVVGCDFVWNCVAICPKGVPPTKAIARTRALLTRRKRD